MRAAIPCLTIALFWGCSSADEPARPSARMTEAEHDHYHVHSQHVAHEHDHEEESAAHTHEHNHAQRAAQPEDLPSEN